jgi:proline racemase/trans-L-3-hydroxyproline dehydratase
MAADDELHVGDPLINESLNGSIFSGRIVQSAKVGEFEAVVPDISGRGAVTGLHQFILDGDDPIQDGFRVN